MQTCRPKPSDVTRLFIAQRIDSSSSMIDMIGAFCNCSSSTQGRSRGESEENPCNDMSLRPLQESYQGIRSAWKSEGPPGGRGVGDCARGAWGWPLDLKFRAPLATVALPFTRRCCAPAAP